MTCLSSLVYLSTVSHETNSTFEYQIILHFQFSILSMEFCAFYSTLRIEKLKLIFINVVYTKAYESPHIDGAICTLATLNAVPDLRIVTIFYTL